MKQIETLVDDIYKLLGDGLPEDFPEEKINDFGRGLALLLVRRMDGGKDYKPGLRMSNIGTPCERKLWYGINQPEAEEEIPPWVRMKFLFGDILEHLLLFMADAAGHQVEGTQDEQEIEGVKGHRDSVIDGVIIDAKSASTYSFKKFADHKLDEDDPFGYVDQIQSYLHAGQSDPIVLDKDRAGFLVIDKTLGKICLDLHEKKTFPYEDLYRYKKAVIANPEVPDRSYDPEPKGKSGNKKLPMICSYCDFKKTCHPNLRTFLYARGPVYLTEVKKEPNVPEVSTFIDD